MMKVFGQNIENLRKLLFTLIEKIPVDEFYGANKVLESSRF
mgnify:FL=1